MTHSIEVEIERNYASFKDIVTGLLPEKSGWYALMRSQRLEGLFPTAGEAGKAGYGRFGDQPFSIQLVSDEPVDLGFYSYAATDRSA